MIAAVLVIAAAPAAAQPDFAWTGNGATENWSDPANWAGGVAPSGSVGTLTFGLACQTAQAGRCGLDDDIAGVDANALQLEGDWAGGSIGGSRVLTLGAGGLTSGADGSPDLELPLALGAPQTWTVNYPLRVGDVTGALPLSIELPNAYSGLYVGDVEVGPVNVSGPGTVYSGGSLDASDGGAVNLGDGAQLQVDQNGNVGPLTLSASTIAFANFDGSGPPPVLEVDGSLTLDSTSTVVAEVGWVGYSPGPGVTEYSEVGSVVDATGTVNLGGASLTFPPVSGVGGPDCRYLDVGQVYTLVHTIGQLTGTFNGIPNGTVVSVPSCNAADTVQINYSSNAVTATVVDGQPGPTWTSEALSPAHPAVNQPVTITTTVDTLYGTPAGTVTVYLNGGELPGCVGVPVQSSGSTGLATCQTSFDSAGEQPIGAEFDSSNTQTASSSSVNPPDLLPEVVSVAQAPSSASLSASATRMAEGANVTYTATVAPGYTGQTQPTGFVEFLRGGKPIAACDHQPLTHHSTSSAAQCKTSFAATGTDAITAHYSGDANFTGSTTSAVRTVVVRMSLFARLSRAVKRTKFAGLWTPRGADLPFDAQRRGELVIRWYLDTGGGHKRLIATTKRRFKQPGTVRIRLVLDRSARRTLSNLHHARVTAEASFTAPDAQPVRAGTSFTIKR